MPELSKWVSISEAERLTGLSTRTVKRMIAEGQLRSGKTRGGHLRVLQADLDKLLRPAASASASPSSVLQNKRERVEELNLEAQELRAKQQVRNLREEQSQARSARSAEAQAQVLAQQRALEETRLQRDRVAQERERVRKQDEREQWERSWVNGAVKKFPDWLLVEQEQAVIAAVRQTLWNYEDGDDPQEIGEALMRAINRVVGPWKAEREAAQEREEAERQAVQRREWLIDLAMSSLPFRATDAEKLSARAAVRDALARIPLSASEWGIQAAINEAVGQVKQAIERRVAEERDRAAAARAQESAKWQQVGRDALENAERQRRESAKKTLVTIGELRVASYIRELCRDGEMDRDALYDRTWQAELEAAVREKIERDFNGTETFDAAQAIAEQIVDETL